MIVRVEGGWRVVSESKDKSGKRKNLGTYKSKEGAEKRLKAVEYFKHKRG